jgi:hypothetical protein
MIDVPVYIESHADEIYRENSELMRWKTLADLGLELPEDASLGHTSALFPCCNIAVEYPGPTLLNRGWLAWSSYGPYGWTTYSGYAAGGTSTEVDSERIEGFRFVARYPMGGAAESWDCNGNRIA